MALGADPRSVVRMVLRGGMTLAVVGIALGMIAAAVLSPALASLLFGDGGLEGQTDRALQFREPADRAGVPTPALPHLDADEWALRIRQRVREGEPRRRLACQSREPFTFEILDDLVLADERSRAPAVRLQTGPSLGALIELLRSRRKIT
jgi:hypothetical protein